MATKPVFKDTDQGPVIRRKLNEMGDLFVEGMANIGDAQEAAIRAKQYRDEAEGFKDISVTKAGEAESHATDARASKLAAAQSETNAKASELAAKGSETASALSETNAKASELAAKGSETASALSETNAKASELAASTSETNSALSESNAKASELLAKDWAIKEGDTVDGVDYSAKHYAQMARDVVAGGTVVAHEPTGTIEFEGIGNPSFPLKANFVGTKSDVGLDQVDNTSDLDKPISTATQAELDLKANASDLAILEDSITNTLVPLIDGKVDKVAGKGLSDENYTLPEKNKLAGIAAGATKNATDAQLRDRSTHTGTQPASSITGLATVATSGNYNDLSNRPSIPSAQVNSDWASTSGVTQILNKPETMPLSEAKAGVSTTPRLITAKVLAAVAEGGDSYQTGDILTTARTLSSPDWLLADGTAYLRAAYPDLAMLLPEMPKLANPADLPTSTGRCGAFSPDGTYLSVAHLNSPYITIYKRSGDTFTKLADPADLPTGIGRGCAFSPDGTYLSVAHDTRPYITIYAVTGDETTFITPNISYPKTRTYIKT